MRNNIAYTLCSINFTYDDEQYTQEGFHSVVKAFKTREAAISEIGRLAADDYGKNDFVEFFEEELLNLKYNSLPGYLRILCGKECDELVNLIDGGVWNNPKGIGKKVNEILSLLPDYEAGDFLLASLLSFYVIKELELVGD